MSILAVDPQPRRRGAAYLRKSLGSSADKTEVSLEIQEDKIQAAMLADGVECVAVFRDVHPRWELWERPQLSALRELVKQRGVDVVYAFDTSRLATGVKHQAILLEEAERHGAAYRFVNEQIDHTSALGQLMWAVTSSFNAMELERIRDRTNNGKHKRVAQGKLLSYSRPNYGYRFASEDREAFVVYAPEAAVVRRVYEAVVGGQTLGDVAVALTAEGIAPPEGGAAWQTSTLSALVRNRCYRGEAQVYTRRSFREDGRTRRVARPPEEWQTMPTEVCPPIVGVPLWLEAQAALARNKKRAPRSMDVDRQTEFLLRGGLAVCAHCGRPMHALTAPRKRDWARTPENPEGRVLYRTYGCAWLQRARTDEGTPCPSPGRIRAEALDLAVWRRVLAEATAAYCPAGSSERKARVRDAERAVRDAERRVSKLERVLENTAAELTLAETEAEKASLRALRRTSAAGLEQARVQRDQAAQALLHDQRREDAGAAVFRALTEHDVALGALVPGKVGAAAYATMRGILDALGVRVVVWHVDAGEGPPVGERRYAVLPWDAGVCTTVRAPSCGGARNKTHDPDRLRALLLRLAALGAAE